MSAQICTARDVYWYIDVPAKKCQRAATHRRKLQDWEGDGAAYRYVCEHHFRAVRHMYEPRAFRKLRSAPDGAGTEE